ncbi:hypothetical protein COP2_036839 [Malus domestica]
MLRKTASFAGKKPNKPKEAVKKKSQQKTPEINRSQVKNSRAIELEHFNKSHRRSSEPVQYENHQMPRIEFFFFLISAGECCDGGEIRRNLQREKLRRRMRRIRVLTNLKALSIQGTF